MWFVDENSVEASPFFTCRAPAQQLLYYSLAELPPSGPDKPPLVFTNLEDVLEAAARNPGSKIKVFHDEISAIQYSYLHHTEEKTATEKTSTGEAQLPFRAPSQQDLMKFRKTIEQGDLETFLRYLWCNPRFLVSEGDTAVILQEGCRYNALHVAVKSKQPYFCEYILNTVTSRRFLRLLYPQDDDLTLQNRIFFLADQYLNTPDKGRLETPLHFAAKFGCYHCCRCLLLYHQCDKTRRNKDRETAYDIICSRAENQDNKTKIQALFNNMSYVPLLRSPDNTVTPQVGVPCSALPTTSPQLAGPNQEMQVKAYAGPMAYNLAKDFFKQWKQSPRPSKIPELNRLRHIRLTDSEKGLETYGRHLSKDFNVEWSEYWPFLDSWCNFQTHAGLAKLEAHLIETKLRVALQKKELKSDFLKEEMSIKIGDSPFVVSIKPKSFWEEHGTQVQALNESLHLPSPFWFELSSEEKVEDGLRPLLKLIYFIYLSLPHLLAAQELLDPRRKEKAILEKAEMYFAEVKSAIGQWKTDGGPCSMDNFHQNIARLVTAIYQPQHTKQLATLLQHLLEARFEDGINSPPVTKGLNSRKRVSSAALCGTPVSRTGKGDVKEKRRLFASPLDKSPLDDCPSFDKHYWCVVLHLASLASPQESRCSCDCEALCSAQPNLPSLVDVISNLNIPTLFTHTESSGEEADEDFYTPPQSPQEEEQQHLPDSCFLTGELPNKLDLDVYRAIKSSLVTLDLYPNVHRWMVDVSKFPSEETTTWMSPAIRGAHPHHRVRPHTRQLHKSKNARQLF